MSYIRHIERLLDADSLDEERHQVCCGASSLLWYAVCEAEIADNTRVGSFRKVLDGMEAEAASVLAGDVSRQGRCLGLLNIIRAFLGLGDRTQPFFQAAAAFEGTWNESQPHFDQKHVEALDNEILGIFGDHLDLKTSTGWLIYDALWHLKYSKPGELADVGKGSLLAREVIPTLFTGNSVGSGNVLHLVAEVLPGPPGLVTPDWWPMGLIQFPRPSSEVMDFLTATQQVMRAVAVTMKPCHRIRWRLEYRLGKGNPWRQPVIGRSATAAAAIVTRAVYEALSAPQLPVLDPEAAITACLPVLKDRGTGIDFATTRLEHVDAGSLRFKLEAAANSGLTTVLAAPNQLPTRNVAGLYIASRDTLEEAYQDLLYDNQAVVAFRQHVVRSWKAQWCNLESPP